KQARQYLRIASKNNCDYLLLPVPHLYNDEKDIEAGFAVNATPDNFDVYAYMYNYNSDELLILSKLPHCVHKAFVLDAQDYELIEERDVSLPNRMSAILFISNYLTDLKAGIKGTPMDYFDDKLYQQLITRLISVHEPNWCSDKLIELRFNQLLENYNQLNENDELYKNSLLRANIHMINFLFGCEDNISNKGFLTHIDPSKFKPYIQKLYQSLIIELELKKIKVLSEWSGVKPKFNKSIIQSYYKELFEKQKIDDVKSLIEFSGIMPNEEDIQHAYKSLFEKSLISLARKLLRFVKIKPNNSIIQSYCKTLLDQNKINSTKELFKLSGIKSIEDIVQSCYKVLFKKQKIHDIINLIEFSGILPNEEDIQYAYKLLFENGLISLAGKLLRFVKIKPNKSIIQSCYKTLLDQNKIYAVRELFEFSGIRYNKPNRIFRNIAE
ncbi:MAG: hypothetical protein ACTSQS_12780, partial [Promethearchaeota archaeon]